MSLQSPSFTCQRNPVHPGWAALAHENKSCSLKYHMHYSSLPQAQPSSSTPSFLRSLNPKQESHPQLQVFRTQALCSSQMTADLAVAASQPCRETNIHT